MPNTKSEVRVEQDDAVVHVVEDGLHHRAGALDVLLGLGQRLLAVLQFGDVAIDAEHAAVGQRLVVELDVAAARRAALVAAALRIADDRCDLLDLLLLSSAAVSGPYSPRCAWKRIMS